MSETPAVKNATRKPHYKSRKGCLACKKRHVKCNEVRPKCSHCFRLEIECLWPDNSSRSISSPSSLSPNQFQPHSPASSGELSRPPIHSAPSPPPQLAVNDLKLLHFWTINTATSMTHGLGGAHIWQSVMVEIGFRHHFLLHSILAVAAVHKAIIFPAERDELITQSSAHIDIAITSFRDLLETPLPATCVPVFLTAGLLSIHSLGMAQLRTPTDPIADIYTFMRLVKGTQSTIRQNWPMLQTSEIAPLLTFPRAAPGEAIVEEVDALKTLVEDGAEDLDASNRTTYLETIHQLQIAFDNVRRAEDDNFQASSQLSSWVALVPPEYHELLASREPVALVIIAYFAVLFRVQPHVWWFRNWGGWILESVRAQLPRQYERWLEWPASQIGSG